MATKEFVKNGTELCILIYGVSRNVASIIAKDFVERYEREGIQDGDEFTDNALGILRAIRDKKFISDYRFITRKLKR